eukprot:1139900-Pelagomonas_calceolata.AAC.3
MRSSLSSSSSSSSSSRDRRGSGSLDTDWPFLCGSLSCVTLLLNRAPSVPSSQAATRLPSITISSSSNSSPSSKDSNWVFELRN